MVLQAWAHAAEAEMQPSCLESKQAQLETWATSLPAKTRYTRSPSPAGLSCKSEQSVRADIWSPQVVQCCIPPSMIYCTFVSKAFIAITTSFNMRGKGLGL